jgi:hypothetical protein
MNTYCLGDAERTCFDALEHSSGFRFARNVQNSWCARRPVNEGLLTLSVLSDEVRLRLLGAWMSSRDTLLDFIARQLPDPSAELAVCRFEQFTLLAHSRAASFRSPDPALLSPRRGLQRALHAGLAFFHDEPALLVAPGLKSLCRVASPEEIQLWERLATPSLAGVLLQEGQSLEASEDMLHVGALEYAC